MRKVFLIIAAISALIGGLVAFAGVMAANGAPQEAAAAAVGLAIAVIPYCFARTITEFKAIQ